MSYLWDQLVSQRPSLQGGPVPKLVVRVFHDAPRSCPVGKGYLEELGGFRRAAGVSPDDRTIEYRETNFFVVEVRRLSA